MPNTGTSNGSRNRANSIQLEDKYRLTSGRAYMTGIEALVRLPILQHQRDVARGLNTAGYISGYRGSPIGGLDQALWKAKSYLEPHNIVFNPGVNEDLAMTAVWGSQQVNLFEGAKYDGVFGMWYGKGPGLDRSMDVLKHANAFGTSPYGGVLAVVGDDHACKSSTLPHQCEHSFMAASAPVLAPSNVQEILDLGIFGWELSRYSGCWVGLKAITENMDSAISADIDPDRINIVIPDGFDMPEGGLHARWPDKPLEQEERLNRYKIYAAREFARVNQLNYITHDTPNAHLGVITSGKAYLDVLQALDDLGIDEAMAWSIGLRVFKVGMPWPLEPVGTHEFAKGLTEILVVEEKRSVIEDQLTGQLYNWPVHERPRVVGEYDEHGETLLTNLGELTPAMVARAIAARLKPFYRSDDVDRRLAFLEHKEKSLARPRELVERTPHYCSGCPHNTSTKVPEGSRALAGIGCHYMVTWMDRETHTFTQMGGEGATWLGQAPFTETKHVFQNLGDGTYFHSGLLAIRAAVASGANITYKILYNDAVAMTGGQPVDGPLTVAKIIEQLRGEGIARIAVVTDEPNKYPEGFPDYERLTIDHRNRLDTIQKAMREEKGTSVIIYDQTCAAEKRRRRKKGEFSDPQKRVLINSDVCEGCGDCGEVSNCLSVLPKETELGRKRTIDQSACNKDYSCVEGFCPSFVTVHGGQLRKQRSSVMPATDMHLPDPTLPLLDKPWNVVMTGIGGTGVLTISSILGMAAHLQGKGCSVLNLTGLAQKFGAVVSHVRIGKTQGDIHAVRVPAGDAHLLLGCDLVVAAGEEALAKVNQNISYAIINDYESPTAAFTRDPDVRFPKVAMKQAIAAEVGEDKTYFINASQLAVELMGDAIGGNLFLLGFAYQKGLIPVEAQAIEQSIELNGVAVEFNKQAFQWGRRAAHDEGAVLKLLPKHKSLFQPLKDVNDIIQYRVDCLTRYQNKQYADRYRTLVEKCREASASVRVSSAGEEAFTKAVAKSYFKLMAIKDEYEVARLFTETNFMEKVNSQFERDANGDFELHFHLAPPMFSKKDPDTGRPMKKEFGPWMMKAFSLLAKMKFLRATPLDVFSYSHERKIEVALISEFEKVMAREILPNLTPDNIDTATEWVAMVEKIRGFGHIKEQSLVLWRHKGRDILDRFYGSDVSAVHIIDLDKVG